MTGVRRRSIRYHLKLPPPRKFAADRQHRAAKGGKQGAHPPAFLRSGLSLRLPSRKSCAPYLSHGGDNVRRRHLNLSATGLTPDRRESPRPALDFDLYLCLDKDFGSCCPLHRFSELRLCGACSYSPKRSEGGRTTSVYRTTPTADQTSCLHETLALCSASRHRIAAATDQGSHVCWNGADDAPARTRRPLEMD